MDPVSAFGIFTGAIRVVQAITQTITGLSALRGKYQNADPTIRSMIFELSTIKSAISELRDWTAYNAETTSSDREYEESLAVAIDGCHAIMDVLSEKVTELVKGQADPTVLAFKARVKVLWNEELMNNLQDRLHRQVLALTLLLQACQCRSSTEQLELLRKLENRRIIKQAADDTATLRSTISSTASSQIDAHSITSRQVSSVGETEFDFDEALLAAPPYQRQQQPPYVHLPAGQTPVGVSTDVGAGVHRGLSIGTTVSANEEYASRSLTPSHAVSANSSLDRGHSINPNDHIDPDHGRSKSVSFGAQQVRPAPGVRRWSSELSGNPPSHSVNISHTTVASTRGRRGRESEFTTSIDLTTQSGRSAPDIIKAAQSGTRSDVERLILGGHYIEECHFHTKRNALMVAAHCGKEDIVDLLIQSNAQLNRTDASGSTALHLAASRGHVDVVELLLMEDINIEAETRLGRTALWVSANNGHLQTTRLLLESRAKVNARADNQMTALHVAARQGDVDIAGLLASYGVDVDARDASMMTALHYACEGGHLDFIELLLNNKADIDFAGSERRTPLICAAAAGQLLVVQQLVKRKSKVKKVDEGGMTALHWAAFNGHVDIVGFLTGQARGSLAWINNKGRTPLHLAAMNSQFAVVEYLVRKNCPLETRCASGLNVLHYACRADSVEIVRLLLTSGANIESPTETTQQRPIHIAATGCSIGLIRLLCEKKASLEARDAEGDRALCVAARNGHVAAVQALLDFGSQLQLRFSARSHEDSPLCLAAKGGHLPVVSLLLSQGASALSRDEMGWQPIRYAAYHGHPDVLEALIRADPSAAAAAAANLDYIFSPDSFGMSLDNIGFAPDESISSSRKRRVVELLNQLQGHSASRTDDITVPSVPPRGLSNSSPQSSNAELVTTFPAATSSYYTQPQGMMSTSGFSASMNGSQPIELPGTLEQGLPDSRSATPTHMHRGHQDDTNTSTDAFITQEGGPEYHSAPSPVHPRPEETGLKTPSVVSLPQSQPQPQIFRPSPVRPSRNNQSHVEDNHIGTVAPYIETPRLTPRPIQTPIPLLPELDGGSITHCSSPS